MNKFTWPTATGSRNPAPPQIEPVTESDPLYSDAISARKAMLESIAEMDEEFMNKYLEDENADFSSTEILQALRRSSLKCELVPAICGASLRGKGVEPVLDCIAAFLPSPAERPEPIAIDKKKGIKKNL